MSIITPGLNALNAYNRAAGAGALGAGGNEPLNKATLGDSGVSGPSFGDILSKATEKAIDTQRVSEKVSADAVLGKADLTDVVQAVNNAEMSLNMFLSVRDKLVEAYQRISQTQI
jgi:flagellar hook-basal body complex protein FliE